MSMLISNNGQSAALPAPGDVAAAPAPAGTDVAAAFADWMGLDASAAPAGAVEGGEPIAQADGQGDDDAPQAAVAEPQVQPGQQEPPSLHAMMLSIPVQLSRAHTDAAVTAAAPQDAAPAAAIAATASAAFAAPAPQQAAPAPATQTAPSFAAAPVQAQAHAAPAAEVPGAAAPAAFEAPVTATGAAAPATATIAAANTELKLAAATPAAWQQPLREALGDRLQLQLSRNIDQAVIRLDPPNLGRVEIAIRHMAGMLEVNISATHSEVVRQLHTISDTMRADLAQRPFTQFTEVAVNVTTAPRAAAGQQQAADQQGRPRQQEHAAGDNVPGRGLAEAGNPSSTFSLNGRESYA